MKALSPTSPRSLAAPSFQLALIVLIVLTAVRLIGLHLSVVDLFFDEAQYWSWSRDLAFGYFSKPPLLGWIIAASEYVCGSGEACVRAASPLFYLATSLAVYAIASELYGRAAAFWSALIFALLPGVVFSTRIISTDVPLLFFWAVALFAYLKLLRVPDWRWAIVLGVSLGLGLLAKYAMAYFVLCAVCVALVDRDARVMLSRPQTWIALAIALLILSPNIYWNVANHFVTLKHTGDNLTGMGLRFRPMDALAFVGSQFGVAGPFVFAAFLLILARGRKQQLGREDRLMLAFALPPLLLVTALSFVRGANPNWAAPALISATVLVVAWWIRTSQSRWLTASLALGLFVQAVLLIGDTYADRLTVPALGRKADIYQRTLGWRALGEGVGKAARAAGAPTVAAEGRAEIAALTYYLRNEPRPVVSWPAHDFAQNQFDLTQALSNAAAEPVLLITDCPYVSRLARFYGSVTQLPPVSASSGAHSKREYFSFKLADRRRPIEPLGECADAAPN